MILGHSILLYDSILTHKITLQKRKFELAVFSGGTILDNLHCQNRELTKDELQTTDSEVKQLWSDETTNYLSNFENKLSSGNIRNEDMSITQWRLKRKSEFENVFTPLKTFNSNISSFEDWTAASNTNYEYAIHAMAGDIEGIGAFGSAKLNFSGWVLTNGTDHYLFDVETDGGEITVNDDITIYDGYTKYPAINFSNRKYSTSRITTMPMTFNGENPVFELSVLTDIKNFINDNRVKLLKNSKGELFWVGTSKFSHSYMSNFTEEPFTISFDWIEIADGNNPLGGGIL